jgi:hypothetical protein
MLGALVIGSWALTLSADSIFVVLLAAFVFFSRSVPVSLLFLLSLNFVAFIQASLGGKKSESGRTQKRYGMVFFGNFCALIGIALPNAQWSYPLMFFGLLLTIANLVSSFLFYAHYESLSLKAFLQSVMIPSFVAVNILLKIKAGLKAENAEIWDVVMLSLGLSTYIFSSLLALSKRRVTAVFIYLSQAWLGLLLFLLVMDAVKNASEAFAAIAISALSSTALLNYASKLGGRYFSFAKVVAIALPGAVGFTALYIALKLTIAYNGIWLVVIALGYAIQAVTLIGARSVPVEATSQIKIRFWITSGVQLATGIFLFWLNRGGLQ